MPDLPPCRWSARRVVRCRPSRCRCRAPCCTFRRAGPSPRDAAEVADLVARRHSSGWVLVERRGDRGERRRVSNRCAGLAPRPRTGPSQESRPPRGTDTVPGARPAHHGSAFARIDRIPIAVRLARPVETVPGARPAHHQLRVRPHRSNPDCRPPRPAELKRVPGARPAHHGSAFARIDRIPIAVRLARPVETVPGARPAPPRLRVRPHRSNPDCRPPRPAG